jgi:integrase
MNNFNLPFRYAQRSIDSTRDYVFFAAFDPVSGEMKRKRIYIDHIGDKKLRDRHAKKLVDHINNMLDSGKNPFVDQENSKKYTSIDKALTFVLDFKNLYIRKRTQHSFDSRMKILREWLVKKNLQQKFIFEFTEDVALAYMNDLISKRDISGRTFNNYLIDYRTFFNTLMKNKFITSNPFHGVSKIQEQETDKRPFRDDEATRYFGYTEKFDFDFYIISLYCYYLALRPAEICRLKISDFWLQKGVVVVPGSKSKNKKKRIVPIATPFLNLLKDYFKTLPSGYFICSKGLKPGDVFEHSTRIAEHFRVIATDLKIPSEVKFYCLKDTAADRLIEAGFNTKIIRDLFGHSSIAETDAYLKKFRITINEKLINNFPTP